MNSPPPSYVTRYRFDFTHITDADLVSVWQIHTRLRDQLTSEDIVAIVEMAIKYGVEMDSVPLLQFADVILAFYWQLADYIDGLIEP